MFEQSKPIFGLVKLAPYHEVHIYTQGKIFVEDDISAYEYSKIRVRKCSALSQDYCTTLITIHYQEITTQQSKSTIVHHHHLEDCTDIYEEEL